jgi:hypothetical protein
MAYCEKPLKAKPLLYYEEEATNSRFIGSGFGTLILGHGSGSRISPFFQRICEMALALLKNCFSEEARALFGQARSVSNIGDNRL